MIAQFKSRATKRIWSFLGVKNRPIWQRNYYEHIIRSEAEFRFIWDYIENNPLEWEKDQLHPKAYKQSDANLFNQD